MILIVFQQNIKSDSCTTTSPVELVTSELCKALFPTTVRQIGRVHCSMQMVRRKFTKTIIYEFIYTSSKQGIHPFGNAKHRFELHGFAMGNRGRSLRSTGVDGRLWQLKSSLAILRILS